MDLLPLNTLWMERAVINSTECSKGWRDEKCWIFVFYPVWTKLCKHRQKCEQVTANSDTSNFNFKLKCKGVL